MSKNIMSSDLYAKDILSMFGVDISDKGVVSATIKMEVNQPIKISVEFFAKDVGCKFGPEVISKEYKLVVE